MNGEAWSFEYSIECPVSREFAWQFWTDVRNWKLDADVEAIEMGGEFREGAAGATISRSSGRIEWRVGEMNPGHAAVIEFPLPGASGRFDWRFEDSGGGTRITQRASLRGERAAAFVGAVTSALEAGIPAGMQKLCDSMAKAASNNSA